MTLSEVHKLAEEYATRYNPDRVTPFPYENITAVCPDLQIYFVELHEEDVSGATMYNQEEGFSVIVNAKKSENRQHFTLAHELGHYFLHQDILQKESGLIDGDDLLDGSKILYRLDQAEASRIEKEANHFAASLLMPAALVSEAWDITKDIEKCAKLFKVSTVAMSIRLTELGLVD